MFLGLKSNSYTNRLIFFFSYGQHTICPYAVGQRQAHQTFWYQKFKIVLEYEKILYVLMDEAPEEPIANIPHAVRDTYVKWLNDRTTMHCVIRAAMNDKFSHKFEDA